MSKAKYDSIVAYHKNVRKYYFGKHSAFLLRVTMNGIWRRMANKNVIPDTNLDESIVFSEVLKENFKSNLNTKIVVFEVSEYGDIDNKFITNLAKICNDPSQKSPIANLNLVDLSGKILSEHRFILDGHLKSIGHRVIADEIENIIISKSLLPNKPM